MSGLLKVLLVEDIESIRRGILLSVDWDGCGCMVAGEAENCAEALALARRLEPDLVVTDVRMPDQTGLFLIERLRETLPECEYLILSGYDDFKYAQAAVKLGVRAYLLKPVDTAALEDELREAGAAIEAKCQRTWLSTYMTAQKSNEFSEILSNISSLRTQNKYLSQAIDIISERYAENLTLKSVADLMFISDSYLMKLFKNKMGYTFLDVLTIYRVKAALNLLQHTNLKIYEIAERVGYHDPRYFSMLIKKYLGKTPSNL